MTDDAGIVGPGRPLANARAHPKPRRRGSNSVCLHRAFGNVDKGGFATAGIPQHAIDIGSRRWVMPRQYLHRSTSRRLPKDYPGFLEQLRRPVAQGLFAHRCCRIGTKGFQRLAATPVTPQKMKILLADPQLHGVAGAHIGTGGRLNIFLTTRSFHPTPRRKLWTVPQHTGACQIFGYVVVIGIVWGDSDDFAGMRGRHYHG